MSELPDSAFYGCKNLTDVELPTAGLETIGINAFCKCSNLQHVVLPEGLTTIKVCAFSEADIREIVFPKTLTELQSFAFQANKNLQTAVFQSKIDAEKFGNQDGKKQLSPGMIFYQCGGSREFPMQICFTGAQADWEELSSAIRIPSTQQVVYDYKLTEG